MSIAEQSLQNETHASGLRLTLAAVTAIATTVSCFNLSPAVWFVLFLKTANPESAFFRVLTAGLVGGVLAGLVAMIFVLRARSPHGLALRFSACFFSLAFFSGAFGFALFAIGTPRIDQHSLVGGWAILFAVLCFPLAGLQLLVALIAAGVGVVLTRRGDGQ